MVVEELVPSAAVVSNVQLTRPLISRHELTSCSFRARAIMLTMLCCDDVDLFARVEKSHGRDTSARKPKFCLASFARVNFVIRCQSSRVHMYG